MVSETPSQTSGVPKSIQHARYLAACGIVYLIVCGVALRGFSTPWVMWGFIFLLSLPIAWLAASFSAAKREHDLSILNAETRLRRLLSGSTVRVLLSTLVGLFVALLLFSKLTVFSALDATLFMTAAPLLAVLNHQFSRFSKVAFVARQRSRITIKLASLATAFVLASLTVASVLLEPTLASPLTPKALWGESLFWSIPEDELSAGYALISEYARAWQAAESWAAARASDGFPLFGAVVGLIFEFGSYAGVIALYAFFLMPKSELQRAILPAEVSAGVRPLRATEIAATSATVAFSIIFVYFGIAKEYERYASTKAARDLQDDVAARLPSDRQPPSPLPVTNHKPISENVDGYVPEHEEGPTPDIIVNRDVEKIGDKYYEPGTAQALIEAGYDVAKLAANARTDATAAVSQSFDQIRSKGVPEFLNWYYSLTGDWIRTVATLQGSGEELLAPKLEESLAQTDNLSGQLTQIANRYDAQITAVQARYTDVLQKNLVTLDPTEHPIETATYDTESITISHIDTGFITNLNQRIAVMTGGTAVGGLIAANVARKVAAKGALKVAAKAVVKAAASRGAGGGGGAAGGALAGGAAGSFVPGVGTAIGAVIGGIAGGLAGGIAIDYVVLEIEEYFGRDAFEAEILEAVNEVEARTIANLGL